MYIHDLNLSKESSVSVANEINSKMTKHSLWINCSVGAVRFGPGAIVHTESLLRLCWRQAGVNVTNAFLTNSVRAALLASRCQFSDQHFTELFGEKCFVITLESTAKLDAIVGSESLRNGSQLERNSIFKDTQSTTR